MRIVLIARLGTCHSRVPAAQLFYLVGGRIVRQRFIAGLLSLMALVAVPEVQASKCYGEQECGGCKNCNCCKHCNSGTTEFCSVYYESRGIVLPWKQPKKTKGKKAA